MTIDFRRILYNVYNVTSLIIWQDVAYIIWTGDLTPHDVWSTAKEENIMIIDRLMTLMQQYFPGVPLYPTLGNHESHPVNT